MIGIVARKIGRNIICLIYNRFVWSSINLVYIVSATNEVLTIARMLPPVG